MKTPFKECWIRIRGCDVAISFRPGTIDRAVMKKRALWVEQAMVLQKSVDGMGPEGEVDRWFARWADTTLLSPQAGTLEGKK